MLPTTTCGKYFNSRPSARGDCREDTPPADRSYFNSRPSARGDTVWIVRLPGCSIFQFTPLREGRQIPVILAMSAIFISIHAPPRGATGDDRRTAFALPFQFTPLREGRHLPVEEQPPGNHISIHAPPRGATPTRTATSERPEYFNSRPSARGDKFGRCIGRSALFQFTPLREGRPCRFACCFLAFCISIHAPPRGATWERGEAFPSPDISIHAPPRGATSQLFVPTLHSPHFNSRPSARGDATSTPFRTRRRNFNSRPSARGDPLRPPSSSLSSDFNSRPSARGDENIVRNIPTKEIFQFTPLREGRRLILSLIALFKYFNSRPSARGDRIFIFFPSLRRHFNSRPSARGDARRWRTFPQSRKFQFTPLREGRLGQNAGERRGIYFNSRPSARGDSLLSRHRHFLPPFQFTPLREGRPMLKAEFLRARIISIHAPPRGATSASSGPRPAWKFQFTPLREGRLAIWLTPSAPRNFNSRPSARGDLVKVLAVFICSDISIHAPPRGATSRCKPVSAELCISIHAPPRGATYSDVFGAEKHEFQFTPLREGRQDIEELSDEEIDFNSRPSARGDVCWNLRERHSTSFQFTPLREGRQQKICNFCKSFVQPLQISMA